MGPVKTLRPTSTVAIIANVIENETIETGGQLTFDAEDLRLSRPKFNSDSISIQGKDRGYYFKGQNLLLLFPSSHI